MTGAGESVRALSKEIPGADHGGGAITFFYLVIELGGFKLQTPPATVDARYNMPEVQNTGKVLRFPF